MYETEFVWLFRGIVGVLSGAVIWFISRSADSFDRLATTLDELTKRLENMNTRLAVVEVLVEQHDKELDRQGLEKLVRQRLQDMKQYDLKELEK